MVVLLYISVSFCVSVCLWVVGHLQPLSQKMYVRIIVKSSVPVQRKSPYLFFSRLKLDFKNMLLSWGFFGLLGLLARTFGGP